MLNKVKDFWKAHASDILGIIYVTGASVVLVGLVTAGRIAAYIA